MRRKRSFWTYGVVQYADESLGMAEVYFEKDKPRLWCNAHPAGDDFRELKDDLTFISRAFKDAEKNGPLCRIDKNNKPHLLRKLK